ncbi:ABC transporter permease [Desulfosudis oleivorans]|uniref:ABC transporter permease n=1 Tax=Desulfosudis oleivorans TaxID=181663 RepID=UPI001E4AE07A|nr:ABC transporter permease [Desulfosudis oleivorans]
MWASLFSCLLVSAFIVLPLVQMLVQPTWENMLGAIGDRTVQRAIGLSLYTAGWAGALSFLFGTPFAYVLARKDFPGKRLVESIVDLPIMIPHPVIGIAFLGIVGREHWLGRLLMEAGIRVMGSTVGIVTVLTFVGLPFYINAVKTGIEAIPVRLEHVSRNLGASMGQTFARVVFPLAWRSMLVGLILCAARAISEFGAIVIVAYHPMTAPVLIYERFTAYGLKYSQPVAVWLILVCLLLFVMLRLLSWRRPDTAGMRTGGWKKRWKSVT